MPLLAIGLTLSVPKEDFYISFNQDNGAGQDPYKSDLEHTCLTFRQKNADPTYPGGELIKFAGLMDKFVIVVAYLLIQTFV